MVDIGDLSGSHVSIPSQLNEMCLISNLGSALTIQESHKGLQYLSLGDQWKTFYFKNYVFILKYVGKI